LARRKGLISKFIGYKKTIDFKRFNGKMYLNYITVNFHGEVVDEKTNTLKFETELIQHLLINEIQPNTTERMDQQKK